jgi:hypothetical protein
LLYRRVYHFAISRIVYYWAGEKDSNLHALRHRFPMLLFCCKEPNSYILLYTFSVLLSSFILTGSCFCYRCAATTPSPIRSGKRNRTSVRGLWSLCFAVRNLNLKSFYRMIRSWLYYCSGRLSLSTPTLASVFLHGHIDVFPSSVVPLASIISKESHESDALRATVYYISCVKYFCFAALILILLLDSFCLFLLKKQTVTSGADISR